MADALLVTSSFLPGRGGIESYLAELCCGLAPRLAVLAPERRDGKPLPSGLRYPISGLPASALVDLGQAIRRIESAARANATRRVLFGTPWPLSLIGPKLRQRGFDYAVVVHGAELIVPAALPGLRRLMARALAQADVLFPVSDYTAQQIRKLLGEDRGGPPLIRTLRARVDVERFRPRDEGHLLRTRLGIRRQQPLVLYVGRLARRKGVHRLLEALPRVCEGAPDAVAVVGGTGPEEARLRRLAARGGQRVIFTGRVADEDLPALYSSADVFVVPVADRWGGLDAEGLGVVLIEAAACGTPCVTGRSGGTPEAVLDGRTGFVVDATDEKALAANIAWLLAHRSEAAEMGRRGRDHVVDRFSGARPLEPLLQWLG